MDTIGAAKRAAAYEIARIGNHQTKIGFGGTSEVGVGAVGIVEAGAATPIRTSRRCHQITLEHDLHPAVLAPGAFIVAIDGGRVFAKGTCMQIQSVDAVLVQEQLDRLHASCCQIEIVEIGCALIGMTFDPDAVAVGWPHGSEEGDQAILLAADEIVAVGGKIDGMAILCTIDLEPFGRTGLEPTGCGIHVGASGYAGGKGHGGKCQTAESADISADPLPAFVKNGLHQMSS